MTSALPESTGQPDSTGAFRPEVRRALPALLILRLAQNTAGRMVFTFLPAISRGTGLSAEQMGRVFFARDMTGLAAVAIGRATDRSGLGRPMIIGGLLSAVGLLLAAAGPIGLVVGLILYGIGRLAVHIGVNAWVARVIAWERRGRATGLLEMTWAGAALIGMPLMGVLIEEAGWRSAFIVLGVVIAAISSRARQVVELDDPLDSSAPVPPPVAAPATNQITVPDRNTVATLAVPALLLAAAQFVTFGHGLWLEETYGFDAARIGFAVIAIGAAEAIGSLGSAALADKLGKRLAMILGSAVMTIGLLILWFEPAPTLFVGLVLLVVIFVGFEFAIVSSIPLAAELNRNAPARMVGWGVGVSTVAKAVAALAAGWLYDRDGFAALMQVSVWVVVAGVLLSIVAIREPDTGSGALPGTLSP